MEGVNPLISTTTALGIASVGIVSVSSGTVVTGGAAVVVSTFSVCVCVVYIGN